VTRIPLKPNDALIWLSGFAAGMLMEVAGYV